MKKITAKPNPTTGLLKELPGPFFDFLITDGDHWERAGKVPRIKGIKQEFFNHPDALRVQDLIVEMVAHCFDQAHPSFNYYGPTDFRNENLNQLLGCLGEWVERNRSCRTEAEFRGLLKPYFLEEAQGVVERWDQQWPIVRDELSAKFHEILDRASVAERERRVLLVLGI